MPVLHATMFVALVPAFLTTILLLAHLSGSGNWLSQILTPRRIRILIILLIVMMVVGDLLQYFSWARAPEFTTVLASRQISDDFSDEIVLGGAYAAVLGLENKIPGKLFFEIPLRENDYQQRVLESGLTHLAMESESIFGDIPINDVEMRKNAPEFVEHLELAHIYHVRGYTVNVYAISPD
jgi:hypothetical protein